MPAKSQAQRAFLNAKFGHAVKRQGNWWSEKRMIANENLKNRIGEKNPMWKGGFDKVEYARQWRKDNETYIRDREYRKRFGITLEDYEEMLSKQNGVCAICEREYKRRRLEVDHCHKTGKIRGLLCGTCNRAIGMFEDNPKLLDRAKDYLYA